MTQRATDTSSIDEMDRHCTANTHICKTERTENMTDTAKVLELMYELGELREKINRLRDLVNACDLQICDLENALIEASLTISKTEEV